MFNPLKSRAGLAFLPILAAVAIATGAGMLLADPMVNAGKSWQKSAETDRQAAAEKEKAGLPAPSFLSNLWTGAKDIGGKVVEGVGKFFGGQTREEKLKNEAEKSALPDGASSNARKVFGEDYDKERSGELDKAKKAGEVTAEDLAAVGNELGFVDPNASANKGEKTDEKGDRKTDGKKKSESKNGEPSLLDKLHNGVPYANLKNGEYQKLQSACSVPLVARGTLLVCDDSGKGKFSVEPGRKEGQPDGVGGLAAVKGQDCAPNCGTQAKSGTRSASSQSSAGDSKTGPKGPYYLPTGNPNLLVTVDSCKGPTKPAQTDFPAAGAWGCVAKDDATPKDRFQIELDTMQKSIDQLKKTDPAKAAEMEKSRQEMMKKALLIPNVEALPYDAKIKGALMDMLYQSRYEDCERTLKALEKFKPDIQLCSGCDNTSINLTLGQDGKVAKTSLTLPESFGDSSGRTNYSSLETAANLAQSLELVAGVQNGGGTLSIDAELQAQNLRESVVQSGQTVTPDQVTPPQGKGGGGDSSARQNTDAGGSKASAEGGDFQALAPAQTPATDPVTAEETRRHQADQKEALDDILQSRTAGQIKKDQEKSRAALTEAEKKLKDADAALANGDSSKAQVQKAIKDRAAAKKAIGEQKALQQKLGDQMDQQSAKYDKMVEDMVAAFSAQFERKKKKIDEDAALSDRQKEDAKRAIDDKLEDIKAHPRGYLEAVGKKAKSSSNN